MTLRKKLFWVGVLYFIQGFPFGFLYDFLPVYLREHQISLKEIGLLSLLGLPWTLKFLWAPLLDLWGERRGWVIASVAGLSSVFLSLPFVSIAPPTFLLWILIFCIPLFSATQDIAIDAYTIELMEPSEMGRANGIRVMTARIAFLSMGGFLALAGWSGWKTGFLAAGAVMLLVGIFSIWTSDRYTHRVRVVSNQNIKERIAEVSLGAFKIFWNRRGFFFIMLFIFLFKFGDMAMGPMIKPFWVDRGFTPAQIGMVSVTLGVVMSIAGAMLGGYLSDRWGVFRALWILGLGQAASNLVYALAASITTSVPLIYTASMLESFTGGLGTGPFLAFLMSICDKKHAATQYAFLSALFGLTRSVAGGFSGVAAEQFGYSIYFLATFFLSFPAFILLPWVRRWVVPPNIAAGR